MVGSVPLVINLILCYIIKFGVSGLSSHEQMTCSVNSSCLTNYTSVESLQCPILFKCDNSSKCECTGKMDWTVLCSEDLQVAAVIDCHCITYDSKQRLVMSGPCLTKCAVLKESTSQDNVAYYNLPRNLKDLNSLVCGNWNRDGLLCGKCKENFYPPAYSYDLTCIHKNKCKGKYGDLWKYILAAYGPLTVFCFLILLFRINVTSSFLLAYVVFSQTITSPFLLRPVFSLTKRSPNIQLGLKVLSSINSVWSLDFFKSVYSSMCLKLDSLTIIALEYCIALYPFLFTFLSYRLIKLYDRNIPLVTAIWRPIKRSLLFFHDILDTRTTVVDAYATFFLLSYSKIVTISFTLLMPAKLYSVYTNETKLVLFFDGTKEYFHREHLPYGVLAIVMCFLFNLLPFVVLLFYHSKWFQILLSHLLCTNFAFKATMDLLHSCYKDGTEPGTRDCRWFLATFLSYWMVLYVSYTFTTDSMFFVYGTVYCIVILELLPILQPYKKKYFHFFQLHYALFTVLAVLFLIATATTLCFVVLDTSMTKYIFVMALIFVSIPQVILIIYTSHWLISRCTSKGFKL